MKYLIALIIAIVSFSASADSYIVVGGGLSAQPILNDREALSIGLGKEIGERFAVEVDYRSYKDLSGATGNVISTSPTAHISEYARSKSDSVGLSGLIRGRIDDVEMFVRVGVMRKSIDYCAKYETREEVCSYTTGALPYIGIGSVYNNFVVELLAKQSPHIWRGESNDTTMFMLSYRFR